MHRTLFISNLSERTSRNDLLEKCGGLRGVVRISIPRDRETGRSRGFAFVEFGNRAAARDALGLLNGVELHGRRLRATVATDDRRPRDRPRGKRRDPMEQGRDPMDLAEMEPDEWRRRSRPSGWRHKRHRENRRPARRAPGGLGH